MRTSTPPTRLRALLGAAMVAGLAASVLAAAPASARPLEQGTFQDEYSFTDTDFCEEGITVDVDVAEEGRFLFNSRKPGTAPYWQVVLVANAVYTNAEGDFVTEKLRIADKDLRITDNGDETLTILVLATGNATVYDESGTAIARNPGQVRYEVLIDHAGTPADPSDDQFIEFLGEVKGSTGRTDDFCEAVLPILG
jgi:hypothetical protein